MYGYFEVDSREMLDSCVLFTASINKDGSLGKWSKEDYYLSSNYASTMLASQTNLYFVGGHITADGETSTIDYAAFIASKDKPLPTKGFRDNGVKVPPDYPSCVKS